MLITFTQTSSSRVTCYPPPGPILWRRSYDGRSLPSFRSSTYRTSRCGTIMDSVVLQAPRALYHTAASIPPVGNKTRQGGSIFRSDTVEGFNTRPIRSSSSRRGQGQFMRRDGLLGRRLARLFLHADNTKGRSTQIPRHVRGPLDTCCAQ
jgi:hypothetical protein